MKGEKERGRRDEGGGGRETENRERKRDEGR